MRESSFTNSVCIINRSIESFHWKREEIRSRYGGSLENRFLPLNMPAISVRFHDSSPWKGFRSLKAHIVPTVSFVYVQYPSSWLTLTILMIPSIVWGGCDWLRQLPKNGRWEETRTKLLCCLVLCIGLHLLRTERNICCKPNATSDTLERKMQLPRKRFMHRNIVRYAPL